MTDPLPANAREFVCLDCGVSTLSIAADHDNDQDLCGVCAWLRTVDNAADREALRAFLHRRDMA